MNNNISCTDELINFIKNSPSVFHKVANIAAILEDEGYTRLYENDTWELYPGGGYYVIRGGSALIAFVIPEEPPTGFNIIASHCDSPVFQVKENPEITSGPYVKLNIEKYGGMILSTWFDRPLSVAGRAICEADGVITSVNVNIDRDLLVIPSLAIHMDRNVNEGKKISVQEEMLPLFSFVNEKEPVSLNALIAEECGIDEDSIISTELYLYNRMEGTVWGAEQEFFSSPCIDDLQCAYSSLKGFIAASEFTNVPVYCLMDNEEVGSSTRQGAASTFIKDVLERVTATCGINDITTLEKGVKGSSFKRMLAGSFMISADNAHAMHPNYQGKADPTNKPAINKGVVIKYSANKKYATDGITSAVFKTICKKADVPYQTFANHSDVAGGSTLGNIANNNLGIMTVDMGLPQLAMHSSWETAGVMDTEYFLELSRVFFESNIRIEKDNILVL